MRRPLTMMCMALAVCLAGCGIRERQERISLESEAAERIVKLFWLHESLFPTQQRTNLANLFDSVGTGYPYDLHKRFLVFGAGRGFSGSFYEKYVFAPVGISNALSGGTVIALSSTPFLDEQQNWVRVIIFRRHAGQDGWGQRWLPEQSIHQIFKEANIGLPKMVEGFPKVEIAAQHLTLGEQLRDGLSDWARFLGIGRDQWWVCLALLTMCFLTVTVFLFIGFGRRRDR